MTRAEKSSIPEIRTAGAAFGAQAMGSPLVGGTFGFMAAMGQFGAVCHARGWSPQAAGLLKE
jgi:hypothetical protein